MFLRPSQAHICFIEWNIFVTTHTKAFFYFWFKTFKWNISWNFGGYSFISNFLFLLLKLFILKLRMGVVEGERFKLLLNSSRTKPILIVWKIYAFFIFWKICFRGLGCHTLMFSVFSPALRMKVKKVFTLKEDAQSVYGVNEIHR